MPSVLVGESRFPKDFKRYAQQFSLLELDCEPGNLPGKARLQACAAAAPPGFVFSLVVPARVAALEAAADDDKAWRAAQNIAKMLKAQWWVVKTPASVRPTRRTKEELSALFSRLSDRGQRVAWEPRGVWEQADAADTAAELGVHFVQDIARERPLAKGLLYSRLLALGRGTRIGLAVAEVVAERAQQFEAAFIIVEGQGAREIARATGRDHGLFGEEEGDAVSEELPGDDADDGGVDAE